VCGRVCCEDLIAEGCISEKNPFRRERWYNKLYVSRGRQFGQFRKSRAKWEKWINVKVGTLVTEVKTIFSLTRRSPFVYKRISIVFLFCENNRIIMKCSISFRTSNYLRKKIRTIAEITKLEISSLTFPVRDRNRITSLNSETAETLLKCRSIIAIARSSLKVELKTVADALVELEMQLTAVSESSR